jgi:hypothetical protein
VTEKKRREAFEKEGSNLYSTTRRSGVGETQKFFRDCMESHTLFFQLLVPIAIGKQPHFIRRCRTRLWPGASADKISVAFQKRPAFLRDGAMQALIMLNV